MQKAYGGKGGTWRAAVMASLFYSAAFPGRGDVIEQTLIRCRQGGWVGGDAGRSKEASFVL